MPLQSSRSKEIAAYVQGHEPEKNMAVRVEVNGQLHVLPVYRIPTKLLTFNIRNGRFAAELRAKEAALKRQLDSTVASDAKIIRQLLLEQDLAETEALRADLLRHEQIEPGIATHDGAVINANRRMAVITTIFESTHEPKWEYLKVGILPKNVGEKDLWRIEAGLQFAKDFRLLYGPINELLKLREGTACGLDEKDIAATLLGRFDEKQVKARLRVLELIESYLEAVGRPGDYELIGKERSMEKFNSLSDNVLSSLKASDVTALERNRLAQAGFGLIKAKDVSYLQVRQLAEIARDPEAKASFFKLLPKDPLSTKNEEALKEAFATAKEITDSRKERDKPDRLLTRALTILKSIDIANPKVKSSETQALVQEVIVAANALVKQRR